MTREWTRGGYTISCDPKRLDIEVQKAEAAAEKAAEKAAKKAAHKPARGGRK